MKLLTLKLSFKNMNSIELHNRKFNLFIDANSIQNAIDNVANDISRDYKDRNPVFLGVLNGSFLFTADVVRRFEGNCEVNFIRLASYQGTDSTGTIKEVMGLNENIKNRDVLILEDIVDSGNTLEYIIEVLRSHKPRSLKVATFLFKPKAYLKDIPVDYVGIEVGNEFLVGYGLDFDGHGRNLEDVYIIEE